MPPADCPADISAEIIADGDFADLIPREVDAATQALFYGFGPMHTIGSELADPEESLSARPMRRRRRPH